MSKAIRGFAKFVGGVIAVSAAAGAAAFVKQEVDRKKEHSCTHEQGLYEKYLKRPLDCGLATGALIVLSPVLGITALLVRTKLGSPVLFTQNRPGRIDKKTGKERIFKLYKFRSMTNAKDENGELLPDDVRLTKFGRSLRSTSIDELPELLNIIKGDMAIVGPRPLLVEYLPYYTSEEHHRHDVRPGITGYAQTEGRNLCSWDEKFSKDIEYTKKITFIGDLKLLLKTVVVVLKREGISSKTSATMEAFTRSEE